MFSHFLLQRGIKSFVHDATEARTFGKCRAALLTIDVQPAPIEHSPFARVHGTSCTRVHHRLCGTLINKMNACTFSHSSKQKDHQNPVQSAKGSNENTRPIPDACVYKGPESRTNASSQSPSGSMLHVHYMSGDP